MNSKKLQARFDISGTTNSEEERQAGRFLLFVYGVVLKMVDSTITQPFYQIVGEKGLTDLPIEGQLEIIKQYEKSIKDICDSLSTKIPKNGYVYKIRENNPIVLYPEYGYFKLCGYKEKV